LKEGEKRERSMGKTLGRTVVTAYFTVVLGVPSIFLESRSKQWKFKKGGSQFSSLFLLQRCRSLA
jgi:hypothetical protein